MSAEETKNVLTISQKAMDRLNELKSSGEPDKKTFRLFIEGYG